MAEVLGKIQGRTGRAEDEGSRQLWDGELAYQVSSPSREGPEKNEPGNEGRSCRALEFKFFRQRLGEKLGAPALLSKPDYRTQSEEHEQGAGFRRVGSYRRDTHEDVVVLIQSSAC
jgi:hypothetical protein